MNPRAGYETSLNLKPVSASKRKRVAVVGSGPAGLAAATGCAERGHSVTLFEAANQVGGQVKKFKHAVLSKKLITHRMLAMCWALKEHNMVQHLNPYSRIASSQWVSVVIQGHLWVLG